MATQEVLLREDLLQTGKGFKDVRKVSQAWHTPLCCPFSRLQIHVLFVETYYNKADESYPVLCIDAPIQGGAGMWLIHVLSAPTRCDCSYSGGQRGTGRVGHVCRLRAVPVGGCRSPS